MYNITLFNNIQKEIILHFTNRYVNKTNVVCNTKDSSKTVYLQSDLIDKK